MQDHARAVKWDALPYISGKGLDIGCGDARIHDWPLGIDINGGSTQRGPNILADARDLSLFASESQDFIFSSYLLNELEDWPTVLAGWWRLLKEDGYLILFLPVTDKCGPKNVVDAMVDLKPWQFVEARLSEESFFHVYRKCDRPTVLDVPKPEKIIVGVKLGAHGDALWASSVFPHWKEQGYHVILYTQETGESVLRHDPHIDQLICFESRVPMNELGELFQWIETKYQNSRILVECVEGTLLPSPQKIQYHFPLKMRHKLMDFNYLEMHHLQARVPLEPRVKFYPSDEEKVWANELRATMKEHVVVLVPNGSSVTKYWPYAGELAKRLLEREDVTVVAMGSSRGCYYPDHPRFVNLSSTFDEKRNEHFKLDVRKSMTFIQLANVVVGQETGLLNCVSHEPDVRKIALLTHSSVENLTRDWPNTASLTGKTDCGPCHLLHYDWSYCNKDEATGAAKCQSKIGVDRVLREVEAALPEYFEKPICMLMSDDVQVEMQAA